MKRRGATGDAGSDYEGVGAQLDEGVSPERRLRQSISPAPAAPSAATDAVTAPPFFPPALRAADLAFCFASGFANAMTSQPTKAFLLLNTLISSSLVRRAPERACGRGRGWDARARRARPP